MKPLTHTNTLPFVFCTLAFLFLSINARCQNYRASASAGVTTGATSLTINKPAGTATGDVMIAAITVRPYNVTITTPAGWTIIRQTNQTAGTNSTQATYWKTAAAGDLATTNYKWTFSVTATTGAAGGIASFYNIINTAPMNAENGAGTISALTHSTPSVNTTVPNTMVISTHSLVSSASWTPPATPSMVECVDQASNTALGSGGISIEMNYVTQPAAGATGIKTATASNDADNGIAQVIALVSTASTTISYAASPYCTTGATATVTRVGLAGGSYSAGTGLSINNTTGEVNPAASTPGTYTVTYTYATGYTTTATLTIGVLSVTGIPTESCIGGGNTGTITATGAGGFSGYTYNINAGAYQALNLFSGLANGSYAIGVRNSSGCTASAAVTVSQYPNSPDNQGAAGTNTWIGHIYDEPTLVGGPTFANYIGQFTEAETFDESFGGNTNCFNVVSGSLPRSVYTEAFSVRYRMTSTTRKGLYVVNLGSDDGSRLTVDGTMVYNNWTDQGFISRLSVLLSLKVNSSLLYEFYENGGGNQVVFQTLTLVFANTLATNLTQNICLGNAGVAISGDIYGALPTGITLSGTGYQWSYSTTPGGTRINITGATAATFTPLTNAAPFNAPATYYLYRNASLSSINNISPSPFVTTHESNAATLIVWPIPSATINYAGNPFCSSGATASVTITGTAGGAFSSTGSLLINTANGDINVSSSPAGTYVITYSVAAAGGCAAITATKSITISAISNNLVNFTNGISVTLCATAPENGNATLTAPPGAFFNNVGFASYGTPTGNCAAFSIGSCHAATSQPVAEAYLLGKNTATVPATNGVFGDPCVGTLKQFYVQASYTQPICAGTSPGTITGTIPTGATGVYTCLWESCTTSAAGVFSGATGTNNGISYVAGNLSQTTWYRRTVISGSCSNTSPVIQITVVPTGTWTGVISNNWNDMSNWSCGGLPTAATNVTIPAGLTTYPVVGTSPAAVVKDIVIQSGATLTVTGATLQINGTMAGTLDASAGSVEMNGSSVHIPANAFTGNTVKNLLINNNITLDGAVSLTGMLTMGTANKTLATNNFLTLQSSATATASVAALPVDASGVATSFITGNVTVERFIPDNRAWRLLTSPLSYTGSIFNAWQNGGATYNASQVGKGTLVTGPTPTAANGLDASALNTVSMKSYNANQSWANITNTKSTNLSNSTGNADNVGYFVFVRGDRNPNNTNAGYSSTTTLSSTGKLQTGRQTFIPASSTSYSILGNPYASPIDFSKIVLTKVAKRFYVWDATLNTVGAYIVVDGTSGTYSALPAGGGQNQYIQSGQAFFVQSNPTGTGTRSLVYEESTKSSQSNSVGFRPLNQVISLTATLNLLQANNSVTLADATRAEFDDGYCQCVDIDDAVKFTNTNETFSLLRNGTALAIERNLLIKTDDTLYFKLIGTSQRNYQLVTEPANLSQPGLTASLQDKYTGLVTPVSLDTATIFNFTINTEAGSKASERFKIVFKQGVVLPVTYRDVKAFRQNANIAVQWEVENQVNIRSYEVEKSIDGIHFTTVNTQYSAGANGTPAIYHWLDTHPVTGDNFYRIRNTGLTGETAYSKIVKVNTANATGEITVYPNPVTGGKINLQLNNMPVGKYFVRLLNPAGEELITKEINHAGGTASKNILLSGTLSKGMYTLEITNPGKKKSAVNVISQ